MDIRERLRSALPGAIKSRDAIAVAALRSALAAIENGEAVDASRTPAPVEHPDIAGGVVGLGAGEVARRQLTPTQMEQIVRGEVADRQAAERDYRQAGQREVAERLRGEAEVLLSYLSGASPA
jgi:uncharacterized protein